MNKGVLVISFATGSQNGVGLLAEQLKESENIKFEFFSKSLKTVAGDIFRIIKQGIASHTVVINYVFLCLLFAPIFRVLGKRVVFIPHEGEPLFPKALKGQIQTARRVVASKQLTKLCIFIANKTFCLSKLQARALKSNDNDIIHFGADFPYTNSEKEVTHFFFPNRKYEEIKGFVQISSCHHLITNRENGELSYQEMLSHYAKAQVVLIPSIIETYSYCMVEAMLANSIVVTTRSVGLAFDLEIELGAEKLREYGIYMVEQPNDVAMFVLENYSMLIKKQSKTRELAKTYGLDGKAAVKTMESLYDGKK
ncbi:hypothetical protein [Pseudoalteromonas sp. S16_S37]|uniref:hypothetical protein n=1 Tax=Pseudoalteromonas sp. S16_S37 TaxID=2720228 RepID=UPI0016804CE5|nr:hypothetical protein [Pseudoalteromonas sp. S16_S37]MBD1580954.1 glycosyltransferase family 4 protein [Pseudoalteromonas sp. S16_S37]